MHGELSLVVHNLAPVAVYSSQNCHIFNQDLANFILLHICASELLPGTLATELGENNLKEVFNSRT